MGAGQRFIISVAFLVLLALTVQSLPLPASAAPASPDSPRIIDDFEHGLPSALDAYGNAIGFVPWMDSSGSTTIALSTKVVPPGDPLALPGQTGNNTLLQVDHNVNQWGGFTHAFQNSAVDTWVSQDWSSYLGLAFWFYGSNSGQQVQVDILDNRSTSSNPACQNIDSAERFFYRFTDDTAGWKHYKIPFTSFKRRADFQPPCAPDDGLTLTQVFGYAFGFPVGNGASYIDNVANYGTAPIKPLKVNFSSGSLSLAEGSVATIEVQLTRAVSQTVKVNYAATAGTARPTIDFNPVAGTLDFAPGVITRTFKVRTFDDGKYLGNTRVMLNLSNPVNAPLGALNQAILTILENNTPDPGLVDDFESGAYLLKSSSNVTLSTRQLMTNTTTALPGQGRYENILIAPYDNSNAQARVTRPFAMPMDWSKNSALQFWYYGRNTGRSTTVTLMDNRAPDPGPTGWNLVWSDEFSGAPGTPPNPDIWSMDIGDGSRNGNPGWGNSELEYYTNSTENAALDGKGDLIITAKPVAANSTLQCWYGPCQYTSARLLSANKAEFAHGRIEARIKIPYGQGLWPAFWMMGNDLNTVSWPAAGEIDIMENVGKTPRTVYGTLHGPGYSGSNGKGGSYKIASGKLSDQFHTYAVEWEPGTVRWSIDGINYATVTRNDIPAGTQWVFEHPFFLLLNVAVGGYWPGSPDGTTIFPQTMTVDYVRVYQAPDTAERYQSSFVDNFNGWQKVILPFAQFTRSPTQPANAPNDGLGLTEVWGYSLSRQSPGPGTIWLDQVRVSP